MDLDPHAVLGPARPTTTNGISIESAIFAQYMLVTNGQIDGQTDTPSHTEID